MKKNKTLAIVMAVMLSASWNVTVADSVYDEPHKMEQKKEMPNPEKAAKKRTDDMDKLLNLTDKQYKKIYKLYLKEEKENVEKMFNRGGGQHPMNGGRPPMGMGQPPMGMGQPPMGGEFPAMDVNRPDFGNMSPEEIKEKIEKEMKEREEKMLKKIRKILKDDQYEKWLKVKPKAPVRPLPPSKRPKPQDL